MKAGVATVAALALVASACAPETEQERLHRARDEIARLGIIDGIGTRDALPAVAPEFARLFIDREPPLRPCPATPPPVMDPEAEAWPAADLPWATAIVGEGTRLIKHDDGVHVHVRTGTDTPLRLEVGRLAGSFLLEYTITMRGKALFGSSACLGLGPASVKPLKSAAAFLHCGWTVSGGTNNVLHTADFRCQGVTLDVRPTRRAEWGWLCDRPYSTSILVRRVTPAEGKVDVRIWDPVRGEAVVKGSTAVEGSPVASDAAWVLGVLGPQSASPEPPLTVELRDISLRVEPR